MADVAHLLRTLSSKHLALTADNDDTWVHAPCPHCGSAQLVMVAAEVDGNYKPLEGMTKWLRCPACRKGSLLEGDVLYPTSTPLRQPLGLPDDDGRIWLEARTCLGVGAYSAAVMLCRKLLFHVAVAHGLPEKVGKEGKERAPSYMQAVEHLQTEGLITAKMRPWVDRIKDVGNDANHEVTPIDQAEALDVATFTEQLLVLAYEMDALMEAPEKAAPGLTAHADAGAGTSSADHL